jgi:uncharacterized protein with HEPN domain
MATRPPTAFMADVRLFAETIDRFLTGRTLQDFTEDSMLRAAVE